jgi:cell division protein FtsB
MWGVLIVLCFRLLFAEGGVTNYFKSKKALNQQLTELESIENTNDELLEEIERIEKDTSYQKRLVRENLGVIAGDEYLVILTEMEETHLSVPSKQE